MPHVKANLEICVSQESTVRGLITDIASWRVSYYGNPVRMTVDVLTAVPTLAHGFELIEALIDHGVTVVSWFYGVDSP